jgi:hypothetical protein
MLKKKNEEEGQEGKTGLFWGWVPVQGEGIRKGGMRVNMVDVYCIHI